MKMKIFSGSIKRHHRFDVLHLHHEYLSDFFLKIAYFSINAAIDNPEFHLTSY